MAALGGVLANPVSLWQTPDIAPKSGIAKNIIFMVSDGMSSGTLNMADLYLRRKFGRASEWISLYEQNLVSRALMDTASLSSIVTDSAAASSSWGGGHRVMNNALNVGPNGEKYLPILQKFKKAGKKVGCVTTVAVTHATPAGFSINASHRSGQSGIAEEYLKLGMDVLLGGGDLFFSASHRKDKRDLYAAYRAKGYETVQHRTALLASAAEKPLLGIFAQDALPYAVDREHTPELKAQVPTLAEMTHKAIEHLSRHKNGFVIQVESGKVDWAAHANDISALIHEQIAFDDAIKVAMDFAKKDGNTLVIITTDHGNANPGIIYGKSADDNFDSVQRYNRSNEWVLNGINAEFSTERVREFLFDAQQLTVTKEEASELLGYYTGLSKAPDGLYNYRKVPFKRLSEIQGKHNSVGWISMDHSADYVELAMYGPGSQLLKPFVKNTDLHYLMLEAAAVENRF